MKILLRLFLLLAVTAVFGTDGAYGDQDQQPGGNAFTLNIVARKDASCKDVAGNTVFVPVNGNNVKILMQIVPGKREGEAAPFQVTDPCTASMDGDPAAVQLPKDAPEYLVYARVSKAAAKSSMQPLPPFMFVQDESGNKLAFLGKLTNNGFDSPYGLFSKKKGQWAQQDVSGLFEWSGSICYPKSTLCTDCAKTALCCPLGDTVSSYDGCSPKADACPAGTSEALAFCNSYQDEWMLNIGGFLNYLWSAPAKNVKQMEILFYPVH